MSVEQNRERFDSVVISTVIVVSAIWGVLNWPYEYRAVAPLFQQPMASAEVSVDTYSFHHFEMVRGGFPLRYLMREEDDPQGVPRFWSSVSLAFNVILGIVLTVFAGYAAHHISRLSKRTESSKLNAPAMAKRIRLAATISISALMLLTVAAISFRRASERSRANELAQRASVLSYAIVPKPIASSFPLPILEQFSRIRSVFLWKRLDFEASNFVSIPTLRNFGTIGFSPTPDEVRSLAQHEQMLYLSIRNASIPDETLEAISTLKSLRRLDLIGCTNLSNGLCDLSKLDRLEMLDATSSDLTLSKLSPTWPSKIRTLYLSRPRSGSDSLTLSGMPALTQLRVSRFDETFNPDPVQIQLSNLPNLEHIGLETSQRLSLRVDLAPRLKGLGFTEQETSQRRGTPSSLWFRELHLNGVPSLRDLHCDGLDLKEISIRKAPNLKKLMFGRYDYDGAKQVEPISDSRRTQLQDIINQLAKCDGPSTLDLSTLPLGSVDLSPLAQNERVRKLVLINCEVSGEQMLKLTQLKGFEYLDLRGCPISDQDATALLDANASLESLLVSTDEFETIRVLHEPSLCEFIASDSLRARNIDIVGSPRLKAELVLGDKIESLRIRDGNSLLGISVNGPLPIASELKGLRSLKFFAVGGKQIGDDLCEDLWQCSELDHLTIAYGSLSQRSLQKIGLLHKLTVLALPGSNIDDSLVQNHWGNLTLLSDVDLSDTKVSAKTVEFLTSLGNLQKVALNHCDLKPKDLIGFCDVDQLIELEVAGIGMEADCLVGCLRRGMLDRLDLSDTKLSSEVVEVLVSPIANSLAFLGLQGCDINEDDLVRIAEAHPRLAFDLRDTAISKEYLAQLDARYRLFARQDRAAFMRHLAREDSEPMSDEEIGYDPVRGRINSYQFISNHSL